MLRSEVPVVLLWGNNVPSALGGKTCWMSKKDQPAPGGKFSHHVVAGSKENPPTKGGSPQNSEYWLLLSLVERGNVLLLDVKPLTSSSDTSLNGEYPVLYADENCVILQLPTPRDGLQCVAWVPANVANLRHTKCRIAFVNRCPACKSQTAQTDSEAAAAGD
ncbi:uncharacterized protein LOC142563835 isoform X2 [Dermacentor variabilis]